MVKVLYVLFLRLEHADFVVEVLYYFFKAFVWHWYYYGNEIVHALIPYCDGAQIIHAALVRPAEPAQEETITRSQGRGRLARDSKQET